MRPRASQVAKTRLVETEEDMETVHEDVETYRTAPLYRWSCIPQGAEQQEAEDAHK